jgi:hypothetical protein
MTRLKNHLIGRPIAVPLITIILFSVAVVSINSYTKLSVNGFSNVTPRPQTSQNTPTADNKTIQTNLNTPVEITLRAKPAPTVDDIPMTVNGSSNYNNNLVDPFGIKEIYPTAAGGDQWFMNMNDITQDPRASFEDSDTGLTRNPDGSWKVSSTEVRFNVLTSSGYHHELINTLDQQELGAKGYMQSPNDWKNVEITGYLKLNSQGGDVRFSNPLWLVDISLYMQEEENTQDLEHPRVVAKQHHIMQIGLITELLDLPKSNGMYHMCLRHMNLRQTL